MLLSDKVELTSCCAKVASSSNWLDATAVSVLASVKVTEESAAEVVAEGTSCAAGRALESVPASKDRAKGELKRMFA